MAGWRSTRGTDDAERSSGRWRMGWYQIDPATGKALQGKPSSLSRPPDFVLLNAVPGADDEENACYLGDGPWDMGISLLDEMRALLPAGEQLSPDEARALLLKQRIPARLKAKTSDLRKTVKAF